MSNFQNSANHQKQDNPMHHYLVQKIQQSGGWLGFDQFMHHALYAPGLGYYANDLQKIGLMPSQHAADVGSDFVTAPEMSPAFAQLIATQIQQMLHATQTRQIWEFGAGTGALAEGILSSLRERGVELDRYVIVDVSGALQQRQRQRLAAWGGVVQWASQLPETIEGVLLGNEVLDAMPVQLIERVNGQWYERGVGLGAAHEGSGHVPFAWQNRPTPLRPPCIIETFEGQQHDYLTELHPQAEAFIATLAQHVRRGAALWIDYGFEQASYYHPQRTSGTLVCHRQHRVDADPLRDVGLKDITAHINFTGIALAAQNAGWDILGYTTQGHFLANCGLAQLLENIPNPLERAAAVRLFHEHEMGELFKVIALGKNAPVIDWLGFSRGDRTHRL